MTFSDFKYLKCTWLVHANMKDVHAYKTVLYRRQRPMTALESYSFPAERVKLERNPASEINIQLMYSSFPQFYSQDLAIEAEFPCSSSSRSRALWGDRYE